jgi:LPXTG-motif cell wall-anchored protein
MIPKSLDGVWAATLALFATALTTAAPARADLAPDPADPAGLYSMIALALVLVATGIYLYRRRRK